MLDGDIRDWTEGSELKIGRDAIKIYSRDTNLDGEKLKDTEVCFRI